MTQKFMFVRVHYDKRVASLEPLGLEYLMAAVKAENHFGMIHDESIESPVGRFSRLLKKVDDNGITIDGVSFYGAPMFVTFEGEDLKEIEHYEQIPDNIDILITHRPPLGILDSIDDKLHYGSSILLDKVSKIKAKMHLFGHVHSVYGTMDWKGITFSNAGLTDWKYNIQYPPRIMELRDISSN